MTNPIHDAVLQLVSARIQAQGPDAEAVRAQLKSLSTQAIDEAMTKQEEYERQWDIKSAALRASGMGPDDPTYKSALERHEKRMAIWDTHISSFAK